MYGRIPDHLHDLPPLDFFPPSPEAERMPKDLTGREEWLKAEMAKVQTEKDKLQKAHAPIEMRPVNSAKAFLTSLPPHPDEASKPTTLDAACSSTPPSSFQQLPELLNLCMATPQRKVPKFDGNPLNYWKFSRGFTSGVAQYVTDPANRLAFLIDACEGEAREAIDHCTILEPEHGYSEAWKILSRRFGNPSVISKEYIASITNGPPIRPNDAKALLKLADTMKACWLVLSQLNYSSELNTRTTIGAVLNRLPQTIQPNWFDRASEILRANREPSFADLTEYVQGRADSLSIRESYLPNVPRPITDRGERQRTYNAPPTSRVSTLATRLYDTGPKNNAVASTQRPCVYCSGMHYLDECSQFLRLRANARIDFVRSAALCELCLKPRHDAKQCHSRRSCGLNGCRELHHPLLHIADSASPTSTELKPQKDARPDVNINCVSAVCHRTSVALAVLPVTIYGPSGACEIYALLDSGSDSTMLQEDVAAKLGLSGSPGNINVATLNGQKTVSAARVMFHIETSLPTERLQTVKAWSVPTLPSITQMSPGSQQWSKWKHLDGVSFGTDGSQPISLLLGMDVPVAHWVLESRIGRPADPYAVRTPLGWVFLGPVNGNNSELVRINQLSSRSDDDLVSRVETMFNEELNVPPSHEGFASKNDEIVSTELKNDHHQITSRRRSFLANCMTATHEPNEVQQWQHVSTQCKPVNFAARDSRPGELTCNVNSSGLPLVSDENYSWSIEPHSQTSLRMKKLERRLKASTAIPCDISTHGGQYEKGIVNKAGQTRNGAVSEILVRTNRESLDCDLRKLYFQESSGQNKRFERQSKPSVNCLPATNRRMLRDANKDPPSRKSSSRESVIAGGMLIPYVNQR